MVFVAMMATVISPHSGIVMLWWGMLAVAGHRFLLGETDVGPGLGVFAFYCLLAIVLYQTQLWTNPQYYGFSGDGNLRSVGTDDSYFYSLVAYDLPIDFPIRNVLAAQRHHYSDALAVLVKVHRRVFPGLHPLDLLFFNTFGLSFLPFLTKKIYQNLFPDDPGDRWAFLMTLIAPTILASGVILMRDGLLAVTFSATLLLVLRRRWFLVLLPLVATFWLRKETGLLLVGVGGAMGLAQTQLVDYRRRWRRPDSVMRVALISVALLVVAVILVRVFMNLDWWKLLYRAAFLRTTIGHNMAADSGTSTFYVLSNLPVPLRIPLTLLFYLGSPFLALGALKSKGLWVPRAFLDNSFALLFPLFAAWFYRGVLRVFRTRHRGALVFMLLFLASVSLITQASMQQRHKIPLQPMFYVLTAYGVATPFKSDRSFGWLVALLVILVDLVFNALQLMGG